MEKVLARVREELSSCTSPFFIFDDDPDGFASFLLCYRFVGSGVGIVLKARPQITVQFAKKANDYGADKVVILDVALMDEEFVAQVQAPVVWVDHHEIQKVDGVTYANPQLWGEQVPTSLVCYRVVGGLSWVAAVGCVADWFLPDFLGELNVQYPGLLPEKYASPPDILFNSPLGVLARVFSFNLKGKMMEVKRSIRALSRIEHPSEILEQSSPAGKYVWKKYVSVLDRYNTLKERALKNKVKDNLFVFKYDDDHWSLTTDLANELLYIKNVPVVLARRKDGSFRMSVRSPPHIDIRAVFEQAREGLEGHGGGHPQSCGGVVAEKDFDEFIRRMCALVKNK